MSKTTQGMLWITLIVPWLPFEFLLQLFDTFAHRYRYTINLLEVVAVFSTLWYALIRDRSRPEIFMLITKGIGNSENERWGVSVYISNRGTQPLYISALGHRWVWPPILRSFFPEINQCFEIKDYFRNNEFVEKIEPCNGKFIKLDPSSIQETPNRINHTINYSNLFDRLRTFTNMPKSLSYLEGKRLPVFFTLLFVRFSLMTADGRFCQRRINKQDYKDLLDFKLQTIPLKNRQLPFR